MRPNGQTPQPLVDAECEFLDDLVGRANKTRFARTEFDQLHKVKLRDVMYGEQGSICVYCERRLSEGVAPPHVEHWRPLSAAPELAFHWNNLYLSCTTESTCESKKGKRPLKASAADPDLPWPSEFAYENVVGFTSAGHMYVRKDANINDSTRKALELAINDCQFDDKLHTSILNLNHPTLLEARRVSLDSERERLKRRSTRHVQSSEERTVRATQILDQDPRPEHVSVRVAWLLDMLGQGL